MANDAPSYNHLTHKTKLNQDNTQKKTVEIVSTYTYSNNSQKIWHYLPTRRSRKSRDLGAGIDQYQNVLYTILDCKSSHQDIKNSKEEREKKLV